MQHTKTEFTGWHKSSLSGSGENCVYQGVQQDDTGAVTAVGVYDSKQGHGVGPIVAVRPEAWSAFLTSVVND